jgi:PEP-CTERM motif-containing protein
MALSARRRTAVKRGAFAVAIAIVFVALIAAPQLFHTPTQPDDPVAIADVTATSPGASAGVAMTRPRPSGLSTAGVARAEHSLDALATVRGSGAGLPEISDLDPSLVQIPGTSADHFNGADGLFAGDQPSGVRQTQLAAHYPRAPWAGGFGVGPRGGSAAPGNAGGGSADAGTGASTQTNSSQFNPSSPGGNNGDRGNGNSNGGNGSNNSDQPNNTNAHGSEHSQGESHSSSGDTPSDGPGRGPAGIYSNGSSEKPTVSVPEPSTLLLAGLGLSGLMAKRLTQKAR